MDIEIKKSEKPIKYEDAIKILEQRVSDVNKKISNELIWILEHEELYTAGTSYSESEVLDKNIKIIKTNRGGKITYHGPGQLMFYFVIDLRKKKDIRKFIYKIEKTIIETLKYFKIKSFADRNNIGIWFKRSNKVDKVAAIGLFARVLHDAFGNVVGDWQQIIAALSLLSMFLGAFAAIGQTNIKRLMAYSSIAHMGYALMGLAAGTAFGLQALLIYMAIYVTMNIGTFAFILSMQKDGKPVTDIASLNMLSRSQPGKALAMLVLLFSLAGVPPMVGFFGKLYVLRAAFDAGLAWLAIAGVIASVIGAFYYLRIVFFMYFGEEQEIGLDVSKSPVMSSFLMASAIIMVVGVANLFGLEGLAAAAAQTLVQ